MKKSVKIDPSLHRRLAIAARREDMTIEAFVEHAIDVQIGKVEGPIVASGMRQAIKAAKKRTQKEPR